MKMITIEGKARKNGETGTALVITLMVMVIMCLIGAAALMTSSVDLKISGNYRVAKQAFYLADAGLSYVRLNPPKPWFLINGKERLSNLTTGEQTQTGIGNFQADITYGVTSGTTPSVTKKVTNPPEGSGTGIRTGKAYHYTIASTGFGENQAQAQVEMLGYVIGK
jgi:hypothetical protein